MRSYAQTQELRMWASGSLYKINKDYTVIIIINDYTIVIHNQ